MARTTIDLLAGVDQAWMRLQVLDTWEGVAGIEDLTAPRHDDVGNLQAFRFSMDTALGRVSGSAKARSNKPGMIIQAEQKGLEITLHVVLHAGDEATTALVDASARSVSFLSMPLSVTLNALLDNSIDDEAAKIARRIDAK